MDQLSNGQTLTEDVLVKTEPTDNEFSEFFYISSEYGNSIVKAEPTTTVFSTAEETDETVNIKSKISFDGNGCHPARRPRQTVRKSYDCEQCEKSFPHRWAIERHRRSHSGIKPFQCDECGLRFAQMCHIKPHKLTHSGEKKMFVCDECPLVFATRTTWSIHIQLHDKSNDERRKPFCCDVCGSGFDRKYSVLRHLRAHFGLRIRKTASNIDSEKRQFRCDECGKTFNRKDSLNRHLLCHSGYKPFECDECDMRFTQKGHARRHKLIIHRGVKPLRSEVCEECGASFTSKFNLRRHRLMHTAKRSVDCGEKLPESSSLKRNSNEELTRTNEELSNCGEDESTSGSTSSVVHLECSLDTITSNIRVVCGIKIGGEWDARDTGPILGN